MTQNEKQDTPKSRAVFISAIILSVLLVIFGCLFAARSYLLMLAIGTQNETAAKILLVLDPKLANKPMFHFDHPLSMVLVVCDIKMAELFLRHGSKINDDVLSSAIITKDKKKVDLCLLHGPKPSPKIFYNAVKFSSPSIIASLLSHGADINKGLAHACQGDDHFSAHTRHANSIDLIKELVASGADIKSNNNEALNNAIRFRRPKIVEFLLDNGADIQDCSRKNIEIIGYSVSDPSLSFMYGTREIETLSLLLSRGASLDWINPRYRAGAEKALAAHRKATASASASGPIPGPAP